MARFHCLVSFNNAARSMPLVFFDIMARSFTKDSSLKLARFPGLDFFDIVARSLVLDFFFRAAI